MEYGIIAVWPDGTWCNQEDIESYLQFMSDDYILERVLEWDESYCPVKTETL